MNQHKAVTIVLFIFLQWLFRLTAFAGVDEGVTKMTVSDAVGGADPTYNNGMSVVDDTNAEILLETTTTDSGTVSVDYDTSHGALVYPAHYEDPNPDGGGTADEKAVFCIDPTNPNAAGYTETDADGNITPGNRVILTITHIGSDGVQCFDAHSQGQLAKFTFTVCVPKISVPIYQPNLPSTNITDLYNQYWFQTVQTIDGCDNYTILKWLQKYQSTATYKPFNNANFQPLTNCNVSNSSLNTGGFIDDVYDWFIVNPPAGSSTLFEYPKVGEARLANGDTHSLPAVTTINNNPNVQTTAPVGNPAVAYDYAYIISLNVQFHDFLKRSDGYIIEYDWSFIWDNQNLQALWGQNGNPAMPAGIVSAAFLGASPNNGTSPGEFTTNSSDGKFTIPANQN